MQEKNEDMYSFAEVIRTATGFLQYLKKKWWLLAIAILAGAALGFAYSTIQKPKYKAVTTFILEEKSGGMGSLSGLASQFGFDMGGMGGGGSIFAGDNILDILLSKKIIQRVLLSTTGTGAGSGQTLADLFLDIYNWKAKWKTESLSRISFAGTTDESKLTVQQDSVLNLIYDYMLNKSLSAERINKKGSIIKVQVASASAIFSELTAVRLVDEAAKLYLNIKIGTAQANIQSMQRRSDSLLALLNNKSYSAAASQLLDVNPGIKAAAVPVEIAVRDKTVVATLYTEVTKNLEASKMLLSQQTPVIQVLDKPQHPLIDKRIKTFVLIAGAAFICLIFAIAALAFKVIIKKMFARVG